MNFKKIIAPILALFLFAFCAEKEAFEVFNDIGKKSSYEKILKKAEEADIILFGELHNNPINHWLQLELTKDLHAKVLDGLVLGAEMFEADDQLIINEYLGGHYNYEIFKKEAKVWPNNTTDYQPLLDFAVANQLTFIATNIPRRYANMVYKDGFRAFNDLNDDAKKYIAPLPLKYDEKLPGYANMKRWLVVMEEIIYQNHKHRKMLPWHILYLKTGKKEEHFCTLMVLTTPIILKALCGI